MESMKFVQYLSRITHIPIIACTMGGRILECFRDREEQMTLADLDADFFLQALGNLKTDRLFLEEIQEQTYVGFVADVGG